MKLLVTGGAGFIGSHTVEMLLSRGDQVVVIDSYHEDDEQQDMSITSEDFMSRSYSQKMKSQSIASFKRRFKEAFQAVNTNLEDFDAVSKVFEMNKFDAIVHLAAKPGVRDSIRDPMVNMRTDISATLHLLQCMEKNSIKNFVMASSSSVYGNIKTLPFNEEMKCDVQLSPYATSKRCCELLCRTYYELYKHNITCLRFFTVYGPKGRSDMAVLKFLHRIASGIPIDKFGDGSAMRDFTYIGDLVRGIERAIDLPNGFEIYNLGGYSNTVNDLISIIEERVGKKAIIRQDDAQLGDVPCTRSDNSKSFKALDYEPIIDLKQGISETADWYLKVLQNDVCK